MLLAIHNQPGSFSDLWIDYCNKKNISYKIVDCYSSDIINEIKECTGLLWHWNQVDYRAMLIAKQLTIALNKMGIKTYPNIDSSWHFDDKLAEKYLLEAVSAPMVQTHVFYEKKDALRWAKSTTFPKVFKLRNGAGSINVRLVKSRKLAKKLIKKSFSRGFKPINHWADLKYRILRFQQIRNFDTFVAIIKGIVRFIFPTEIEKMTGYEKGYIYFQDFVPDNQFDTRLIVIGDRCFGIRRYNRKNDFRASGSGIFMYDPNLIDINCVKLAFELSKILNTQSIAFDFLLDQGKYKIVEISYCFPSKVFLGNSPGYWDKKLIWHDEEVIPEYFIIEDFISNLK